jgi:hypothetical protein
MEIDAGVIARFITDQQKHNAKMERLTQALILQGRRVRVYGVPLGAANTATSGTPFVLDLGGPPQSFIWEVKQIQVGPPDYTGTIPSGVTTYAFAGKQGDYSAGAAVSWTAQYPAQAFFSAHEAWVMDGERLSVVVTGLATGQPVVASALVIQSALDMVEPLQGIAVASSS